MECPNCHVNLAPSSIVPETQQFVMELQYEGDYLAAATLGGTITSMEQLLIAIAKEAGSSVSVYIKEISYGDHCARVTFMIISQSSCHPTPAEPK